MASVTCSDCVPLPPPHSSFGHWVRGCAMKTGPCYRGPSSNPPPHSPSTHRQSPPPMYLYHLTLQPPTTIPLSLTGHFTPPTPHALPSDRLQELLLVRGTSTLELYSTDALTGKLHLLSSVHTFSIIRSVCVVRPVGFDKGILGVDFSF